MENGDHWTYESPFRKNRTEMAELHLKLAGPCDDHDLDAGIVDEHVLAGVQGRTAAVSLAYRFKGTQHGLEARHTSRLFLPFRPPEGLSPAKIGT